MCLSLRNTLRRGFSALPNMFARDRNFRRSNRAALSLFLSAMVSLSQPSEASLRIDASVDSHQALLRTCTGERLARLDLHDFAFVADALALVRLGLAHAAQLGGELTDGLLIGAGDVNLVRAFELNRDIARNRLGDRIRVADRQ